MQHCKQYNQKLTFMIYAIIGSFLFISCRLIHLQIIQHHKLKQFSERNFLRFKTIPAQRGNIVDCNGQALATNVPVTQLFWQGTGNTKLNEEQQTTIDTIYTILDKPKDDNLYSFKKAEKHKLELLISNHITPEQLCLIAEQCSDSGNILFKTTFNRLYPFNNIACHILGYLGDLQVQCEGKMGLEKIFEETLRGDPSVFMQSMNSFGTLLDSQKIKAGIHGQDVVTTIDLSLQQMIEHAMQEELEGSCIIMDPTTGAIKALVSKPNFDLNLFNKKLHPDDWQELQNQKAFLNRAFNASYPPASIFKLVTIAAALEEKITTTHSHWTCNGYATFKDRRYYCSKKQGHGPVNTQDALALSCNVPFFDMAKRIHIDTLAAYAYKFGLGSKTNIPFSEQIGLIPTNDWKIEHKGERWWTGETLSAAIGQSFLLVTPIQIACMIGSIFHGYLVKPQIIADQPIEKKNIGILTSTRHFLQECMLAATVHGTAQRINKIGTLTIFAKTGTAQTKTRGKNQDPEEEKQNRTDMEHAWFVSYFYTENSPPLVMVMLLEHVGRSTYATKVARKFFVQYMKFDQKKHKKR